MPGQRNIAVFRATPRLAFIGLLVMLLCTMHAYAQSGRITGKVTDPQGEAVEGASVVVTGQDAAAVTKEAMTDASGSFLVQALPSGRYLVTVQAQGFNVVNSQLLAVLSGSQTVFDVKLELASTKSDVTVSAEGNNIQLDTSELAGTLSETEVKSFGLNGRNFSQLITLTPGVSNQTGQDEAKVGVAGSAKFSVNGGRVEYNTFEVDGSDVLNTSINASRGQAEPLMVYPSIDAIAEVKVLTSNYGAQYGKSASGSVIVTTKSGTDKYHGNLYDFTRNEVFNARNYFDQTKKAPLYRRQDFGGTVGGPLYIPGFFNTDKSKTFFFFSEEVRLEKTPVDYNQGVPSVQERQGNFSDVCPVLTPGNNTFKNTSYPDCPAQVDPSSYPVDYENVNVGIPLIDVVPQATSLLNTNIIPLPTSSTGCNSSIGSCYNASVSPSTYWREELFRIDHNLTPGEQLSFRYIHDTWSTTTLTPQWGLVQNSFPTVQNSLNGPGISLVAGLTQTLGHAFLNRISVGYTAAHISLATLAAPGVDLKRSDIPSLDAPCSTVTATGIIGVPPTPTPTPTPVTLTLCPLGQIFNNDSAKNLIPGLEFGGTNQAYGGHGFNVDTGYAPWHDANPTYNLRDDVNKTIGKHSLSFGGQATLAEQNELSGVNGANTGDTQGLFTYSNQQSPRTTNNAFADFLGNFKGGKGFNTSLQQSYQQDSAQARYYNRYKAAEFYLQDDWRVTPRLTVNIGLRASLFGTWYNAKGTAYNWEPQAYSPAVAAGFYINTDNGGGLYNAATNSPTPLDSNHLDPGLSNGLVQCGVKGVPKSCQSSHLFNPGPRVGFAWDPLGDGKDSVRGGYGLFWEHGTSYEANVGSLIGAAPLILSETVPNQGGGGTLGFSCIGGGVHDGAPSGPDCAGGRSALNQEGTYSPAAYPISVASIPTKAVYSYVQQWSLSVERELRQNLVGQVAYVGSKGTHLTAESNLNQLRPIDPSQNPFGLHQPIDSNYVCNGLNPHEPTLGGGYAPVGTSQVAFQNLSVACSGSAAENGAGVVPGQYRPYLGFNQILSISNVAGSQYHALQATIHRTKAPLDLGVAYTYSHSIDDSSDRTNAGFVNTYDLSQNKGSSDFDERHLLNISYIYDLPLLQAYKGVSRLGGGDDPTNTLDDPSPPPSASRAQLAKTLLGGWQLTGITAYQTGTPFSVINGGGSDGIGLQDNAGVDVGLSAGSYADKIGNAHGPKPPGGRNTLSFGPLLLNPGAFAAPRGLTYGNAGRNSENNPSRINFNTALLKHFPVLGERDVEFRAEAFNVFNHTQFRIYDPSHPGNTGNNVISCYGGEGSGFTAAGGGGANCLTGNSFLHPVDAHDPRILQFGLKLAF